jgi:phosphoribosylamine--glycine ligase
MISLGKKKTKIEKSPKNVLIVGSWAKEQITIENIRQDPSLSVFSYMDTKNPGIMSLATDYKIGELHNITKIVNYAKKQNIDLVLITTAEPLSLGLVDELEKENIPTFGPTKKAAGLESDKAFTRQLMKQYKIKALPHFQVSDNPKKAIKFAEKLKWKVAIKPIGLTEGLGVKVFGDQLKNKSEITEYIHTVFDEKIGDDSRILIEEKLMGKEFTIQCFVKNNNILSTPAVKDFKKLLPGNKGPNTASMGSYTDKGFLLPYMTYDHYLRAIKIMLQTLHAFTAETGVKCNGFLYGQFMITNKGLKLIEYNYRPGDPEWINTVSVMQDNILRIIRNLDNGQQNPINFEKKATVCKYIVPKGYPTTLNEVLDAQFDEKKINERGVNIYYSSGLDETGRLNVGCERGIAFVAKADSINKSNNLVEKAISMVSGDFHYRQDIGTTDTIK